MDVYAHSPVPSIQKERLKFSSKDPFVPTFVTNSLTKSSNPQEIYATRIHNRRLLLENPVGQRKEKNKKKKNVQKNYQRIAGSWSLDPQQSKFELFIPLHHLWMGYMSELLGLNAIEPPSSASCHPKLLKADFSGSFISVQKSRNPSLVGLQGIVFHESENTFMIITKENQTKVLPKQNTIFTVCVPALSTEISPSSTVQDIPHLAFALYGNQFCFRSSDRAGRKFKPKETIEL